MRIVLGITNVQKHLLKSLGYGAAGVGTMMATPRLLDHSLQGGFNKANRAGLTGALAASGAVVGASGAMAGHHLNQALIESMKKRVIRKAFKDKLPKDEINRILEESEHRG